MDHVRTLGIIKPDALRARYAGKIISMIETSGFNIDAAKRVRLSRELAEAFYAEHRGKPFYKSLTEFMTSGPCIVLALSGDNAIARWRELMGSTDPALADPGTIRRLYGTSVQFNACHGSDSPESARREVLFFFSGAELLSGQ